MTISSQKITLEQFLAYVAIVNSGIIFTSAVST